jgi:chaperonin cofactor prefoldin
MKQEIVGSNYKLKIVDKNVNTIAVNLRKTDIVKKEMEKIEEDVKLYDRIGRM